MQALAHELANRSMTRHLHEPANALLYRALDLPPEERQHFLAHACEGAPALLELVRTLLARIDVLDEFLETPLDVPVSVSVSLPASVSVSIPASLPAAVSVPVSARPRPEAAPLINIQSVQPVVRLDATVGQWRVLREPGHDGMAAGVPIDQHCAEAKLDLDGRVALFAQVCHAVHCAHQHLLIHRDLRPGNIVITPDGAPKLVNVGNPGDPDGWQPTPLFASPEQLAGLPLTTSADIYCLGAVLYALVSGRSPNAAEAAGIVSTLARPAPIRPSAAVTEAFERHSPPLPELAADDLLRPSAELARRLGGDLDAIIVKAVDLDPARRYASADALAGDLERFVAGAPLAAAAPGAKVGRAPPRRSAAVRAAAALVACALVAVAVAALWHARAGDQRAGQVAAPAGEAPAGVRDKPVASAASYLFLAAARRAAGDLPAAQQAAATALALAEKQALHSAGDARVRRQLSAAHGQLGAILAEQGRSADGLALLRQALALCEILAAEEVTNDGAARDVADARSALAGAMMASMVAADYPAAEQELALAQATYAAQLRASPADAKLRAGLIELQLARATLQNLQRHGRDAVASLAALHALARGTGGVAVDGHVGARIALIDAYIQPRGTAAMAYAAAEQALGKLLTQTEKDPADMFQLRDSALAWQQAGEIGLRASQPGSACRYLALAADRYAQFETSQRRSAIDQLRQDQVQALRKACA